MTDLTRRRRPPPPFEVVRVAERRWRGPGLVRVVLEGPVFERFPIPAPAASLRLLVPGPDGDGAGTLPTWSGNEFLFADGSRPPIRTLTPGPVGERGAADRVHVDVVVHPGGKASEWARNAEVGSTAAVSGPGPGYRLPEGMGRILVGGDETAVPAVGQILEWLDAPVSVTAVVEARPEFGIVELARPPGSELRWVEARAGEAPGSALYEAVAAVPIARDTAVWLAGEAAAMQRIRRHLFDRVGLDRSRTSIRGYWKHGRAGT